MVFAASNHFPSLVTVVKTGMQPYDHGVDEDIQRLHCGYHAG